MAKIAVVIDEMFEDSEYTEPAEALKKSGHSLEVIGLEAGKTVKGKKNQTPVRIEKYFEEAEPGGYDALFIPGGYSPDRLRADDRAVTFVKNFIQLERPVFAICHGPQLLITADVLKGRLLTGYKSILKDIQNAGGRVENEPVVIDGNLVTSRHPGDLPVFIKAILEMLG